MEGNQTTMSSNVAVQVAGDTMSKAPSVDHENRSFQTETPVENQDVEINENVSTQDMADQILSSAKEGGFEEALQRLADGEFDEEKAIQEEVIATTKDAPEAEEGIIELEIDADGEKAQENKEPQEREEMIGRIKELEAKVVNLEERNTELFEKVKKVEINNTLATQTLLEMAVIMHEMLKDEEDDEKKISMLELLVNAMAELIKVMFVPEEEDDQKSGDIQDRRESEHKGKKRSFGEIVSSLREKGLIKSQPQKDQAPQEIQQAA